MPNGFPGSEELRFAADQLAARLPSALAPLARIAFNYRWSWTAHGGELFATVEPFTGSTPRRATTAAASDVPDPRRS